MDTSWVHYLLSHNENSFNILDNIPCVLKQKSLEHILGQTVCLYSNHNKYIFQILVFFEFLRGLDLLLFLVIFLGILAIISFIYNFDVLLV